MKWLVLDGSQMSGCIFYFDVQWNEAAAIYKSAVFPPANILWHLKLNNVFFFMSVSLS